MSFKLRLLGPLELIRSDRLIPLGPAKRQTMLAALTLDANRSVTLSTLTQAVWLGAPPKSAIANLRTYAGGLRRILGDRLTARPKAYELRIGPGELDSAEFLQLATDGRRALAEGDATLATRRLSAALDLWRGTAGEGLPCGPALANRLSTLDEQRLDVFEDYVEAALGTGHRTNLAAQLRVHLTSHPLRERAWGQLALVLYSNGNVTGALTAYREARAALQQHLGIEPGPALARLHRAMLDRDPALGDPLAPASVRADLAATG